MTLRQFECAACHALCDTDTPRDEAMAEYKANFPNDQGQAHFSICDDCYERFWAWARDNAPELKRVK